MKDRSVTVQSVERALRIVNCFAGRAAELGITELAAEMGLSKSTLYGLVNTLLKEGYLEQNEENKKYRLGIKLFEMGSLVQKRMDIRKIAAPYMEVLGEAFGMTVHMAVYRDGEMVYIDKRDIPDAMIIYSQVGKRAPMYCTGIGKAVLAYLPEERRKSIVEKQPFYPHTPHTITDAEVLLKELDEIRKQGYAVDREEIEIGLRCVAAPVFDDQGIPVAAMSISGPAHYMSDEKIAEVSQEVIHITLAISAKLGYDNYNYR